MDKNNKGMKKGEMDITCSGKNVGKSTFLSTPIELHRLIKSSAYVLGEECHRNAKEAGWWTNKDGTPRNLDPSTEEGRLNIAWPLLLMVSELIEAAEGVRKNLPDDKLPHRSMLEVELADAVIRIFDTAHGIGLDLGGAIAEKLAYNRTREDHKPENRFKDGGKLV